MVDASDWMRMGEWGNEVLFALLKFVQGIVNKIHHWTRHSMYSNEHENYAWFTNNFVCIELHTRSRSWELWVLRPPQSTPLEIFVFKKIARKRIFVTAHSRTHHASNRTIDTSSINGMWNAINSIVLTFNVTNKYFILISQPTSDKWNEMGGTLEQARKFPLLSPFSGQPFKYYSFLDRVPW